jgi:hypothetical protein
MLGAIGLTARQYDDATGNRILIVVFVGFPLLLLLPYALYRYRFVAFVKGHFAIAT